MNRLATNLTRHTLVGVSLMAFFVGVNLAQYVNLSTPWYWLILWWAPILGSIATGLELVYGAFLKWIRGFRR